MSKILVTGGCGYIGSHTIVDLLKNGFEVVSVDSNIRSKEKTIDRIEAVTGKRIRNYSVDLCDRDATLAVFKAEAPFAGVIHFAALKSVPESVENPVLYYRNNIQSLVNLVDLSAEFRVPGFVFSSSCSVYGNPEQLPVTEQTPFGYAESPYAHTKQMGEELIERCAKRTGINFTLLRYFNPVGAHESGLLGEDTPDVITAVVPRITGTAAGKYSGFTVFGTDYPTRDGSCVRDYVHVMDIAEAHTLALRQLMQPDENGSVQIYNLGSGNGVTVLEAVQSFERISGKKLNYTLGPRRPGDVVAVYADNTKARTLLGWNPSRDLDTMMRTAWVWEQKMAGQG